MKPIEVICSICKDMRKIVYWCSDGQVALGCGHFVLVPKDLRDEMNEDGEETF